MLNYQMSHAIEHRPQHNKISMEFIITPQSPKFISNVNWVEFQRNINASKSVPEMKSKI